LTVKADLEILEGLSTAIRGLSDEASSLVVGGVPAMHLLPFGIGQQGALKSVGEAVGIAVDAATTMNSAMSDRLSEIATLMSSVAVEFAHADESAATQIASTYTTTSGDWKAPPK
jgi:hypothetical protein